jgi:hypothetical protein
MPSPNDLTTLASLKAWLGITSTNDDALLSSLITHVSSAILNDLGRGTILPTIYNEVHDGGGERSIVLRQWPACQLLDVSVDGVPIAIGPNRSPSAPRALTAILDAPDPAPPGRMQRVSLLGGLYPNGDQNIAVTYRAGYEITAEPATVPFTAPYTVNALQAYGSWQTDGGVSYANGTALTSSPTPVAGAYNVQNSLYTFAAADAGASVVLRYGFIPSDLSRACQDWTAERYAYRARIGQSSKSLGGQETAAFIVKDIPDFVSRLLQPYRRVASP